MVVGLCRQGRGGVGKASVSMRGEQRGGRPVPADATGERGWRRGSNGREGRSVLLFDPL